MLNNVSDNIVAILAIWWSVVSTAIFILAGVGIFVAPSGVVMLILNACTGVVTLVLGFYFGSSNEKNKKIKDNEIEQKQASDGQ